MSLREREAEIRGFEQRAVESALAAKSKDATIADMEKDLAAARASHAEVDAVRATLDQRSAELAKALEAKGAALQRAEQKIVTVEGRIAEEAKAMEAEREEFQARLAKLKEQLEAEQAARAFAEGALQAARQDVAPAATTRKAPLPRCPEGTAKPAHEGAARQNRPPARVNRMARRPGDLIRKIDNFLPSWLKSVIVFQKRVSDI